MKRELLQNTKVQPYTSEDVIERTDFLSGIIGVVVGTSGNLTLTVTHSDDGINFKPISDKNLFPEKQTENGVFTIEALTAEDILNIDIDLIGLKDFIKITASGVAKTGSIFAIALGDKNIQPV